MTTIISQGERFFYRRNGQGAPIIFLHPGIADSRMWNAQMAVFGQHFLAIAPDLRGYGQSPVPNGPFSYHEDVVALIDTLDLGSVWLVGASFGGRVAMDLYLAHPEKVRSLVLVAPVVSGFVESAVMASFDEEEERLLEAGDLNGATKLNVRTWVDGPYRAREQVNQDVRARIAEMQIQAFQAAIPEKAEVIKPGYTATMELEKVRVPTLIVLGELDLPAVVEHGNYLAQGIPGARLEIIPGTAHVPTMEKPEVFNGLLTAFVGESR